MPKVTEEGQSGLQPQSKAARPMQTSERSILQRYVEEGLVDPEVNFNIRAQRDAAMDKMRTQGDPDKPEQDRGL